MYISTAYSYYTAHPHHATNRLRPLLPLQPHLLAMPPTREMVLHALQVAVALARAAVEAVAHDRDVRRGPPRLGPCRRHDLGRYRLQCCWVLRLGLLRLGLQRRGLEWRPRGRGLTQRGELLPVGPTLQVALHAGGVLISLAHGAPHLLLLLLFLFCLFVLHLFGGSTPAAAAAFISAFRRTAFKCFLLTKCSAFVSIGTPRLQNPQW